MGGPFCREVQFLSENGPKEHVDVVKGELSFGIAHRRWKRKTIFLQACLKERVPGNINDKAEITEIRVLVLLPGAKPPYQKFLHSLGVKKVKS